jgi:hypothetical protein
MVHAVNKLIARHARLWIVGKSAEQLSAYREEADQLTQPIITYQPPNTLNKGYYFDN